MLRADSDEKAGGDSVQVREYRAWLGNGFDVREIPFHPSMRLRPDAVVHVFNVDRPFDLLIAARAAGDRRLVVSPIHHAAPRVRAMRRADRGRGLRSAAGRLLPEALREWLGTGVRSLRYARNGAERRAVVRAMAWSAVRAPRMWRAVGRALDAADAVALLAEGEGRDLGRLTGWSGANAVLTPNGAPDLAAAQPLTWDERPSGSIVVVGRVEARKRQLELARAADRLRIPVVVAGRISDAGSAYAEAFLALAGSSPFVRHLGGLDHQEVLHLLGRSRVLVNASWVEVQSLVDLEAALAGCAVITTPTGHSREWLGTAVQVVDDEADHLLRAAAVAAAGPAPKRPDYPWTWQGAAAALAAVYAA